MSPTDAPARAGATAVAAFAVCLAATALHAVLRGQQWFWQSVLAVVVVAGLGAAARRLRLPVLLQPLVSLAGLLVTLTALFASAPAYAGFLPTRGSMRLLGTLASTAVDSLDSLLAPTDATPPLRLLCVGAVGLMALAVDLVAIGGRRPAYAGVPLVLLVAVPAAIRERSVGVLPLLAAAVGFLLLLTLDGSDRTARWGTVLPGSSTQATPAVSGTAGPAVRIGAAALVAALFLPVLVPGARTSRFAAAGPGTGPGRGGTVAVVDPFVSVYSQLTTQSAQTFLTVRTTQPTYVRLTALEVFDDRGFSLGQSVVAPESARVSKGGLPGALPGLAVEPVHDVITASDAYAQSLLPVPQDPTRVQVDGDWRLAAQTDTVFSANANTRGRTWTVDASVPQPSSQQLAGAGGLDRRAVDAAPALKIDLATPADLPAVVAATARSWTAGATTAYQAALDIQQHFTSGAFTYDTSVAYDGGPTGFLEFLDAKRGFCEQYAATMTAMLRTLGIPARVAIGFTAGAPDAARSTWTVKGADAHAWPEVWFDGAGWVRFEPTPLADGQADIPPYATGTGVTGQTPPTTTSPVTPLPDPRAAVPGGSTLQNKLDGTNADGSGGPPVAAHRASGHLPVTPLLVLAAVLALLVPVVVDRLTRRRRLRTGAPELVWAQLLDDAADRLTPVPPADSPRAAGRRLLAAIDRAHCSTPAVTASVGRLVDAVEQTRYAPTGAGAPDGPDGPGGPDGSNGLAADERRVRKALTTGLPAPRRLQAQLFPASARARAVAPLSAAAVRLLRGIDRIVRLGRTATA